MLALKFLPYFEEARTSTISEKIKEISDSANGDVSSQGYFALGLFQLTIAVSQSDLTTCITILEKSKKLFQAASQAVENRDDAKFYLLFIDWCIGVLKNDAPESKRIFDLLESNLLLRQLYEFEEFGLELDFLIYRTTGIIKSSLENVIHASSWIEFRQQVQSLLNANLEIEKIKNLPSSAAFLKASLFGNLFECLEKNIYQQNLFSEKAHLASLKNQTDEPILEGFINKLIALMPAEDEAQNDNNELLALLAENLGSDNGLKAYEQIKNKKASKEVLNSLGNLLRRNNDGDLPFRTGSIQGEEILVNLMAELGLLLPNYPRVKWQAFFNIVEEVIRYARITFTGNEKKRFLFLFSETEGGSGQKASEQDLQNSMISFFEHSKIADGLEHEKAKFVDGGRVDILYNKDIITIPIELKKSLITEDKTSIERNYIAQAQTYTSGYDQVGIFVLLDLTDKATVPPPNFKDWFCIHHLPTSSSANQKHPDYIISVLIPGNRTLPSSKSKYN